MLVSHPSNLMAIAGPLGVFVSVIEGVSAAVFVEVGAFVLVGAVVEVATMGVDVFTLITTGVGV